MGIRAWVHIADVSHFVAAGSPLDRGAEGRAFSTYVPGRVAPMLPPQLADDLCSLRPDVDRLAVTVEFPPAGEPLFYRSVIRSRARLTYAQAERGEAEPEVAEALRLVGGLTEDLRRKRFDRGALRIESTEIQFAFDGRGGVERAWRESEPHAHMLVEELMIRANEAVAGLLAGRKRESVYRVHERPDPQAVALLLAKLGALDVPTPPEPEHVSPREAERVAAAASERVTEYVQPVRAGKRKRSRRLSSAPSSRRATTLATSATRGSRVPYYCHFTSPIRRYPDLVCAPRAAAGDRPGRRGTAGRPVRDRGACVRARAGRGPDRVPRRRDLSRVAARPGAVRARAGSTLSRARSRA